MTYATIPLIPEDQVLMDWTAIHKSASAVAREKYLEKYGLDYHDDPEYATGNERHAYWLSQFEARYESLILNPHQD